MRSINRQVRNRHWNKRMETLNYPVRLDNPRAWRTYLGGSGLDACILAILKGDKQGLKDIYNAYLSYIYRIVYGVVGNREDAEGTD